jgi:Zn-dependent M16 (insulinase) family peptidase
MNWGFLGVVLLSAWLEIAGLSASASAEDLSRLKSNQQVSDFRVTNLYADTDGRVVGAKFQHISTGAPVFFLQIETVPQAFIWVDTPDDSNKGLPHSLEHLLAGKGTKGRYFDLLQAMRFGESTAATYRDFNFYGLSSATGRDDFFEEFHALLDALYHPDFSDIEAEREFYHFAVVTDAANKTKTLIEAGSVYDEQQSGQGKDTYFYQLNSRVLGPQNPLGFNIGGIPDEMRGVTPEEIRRFHAQHYWLGPGSGFIFALSPKEDVADFLKRLSQEFQQFSASRPPAQPETTVGQPKYPIHPSERTEPVIYPFPGASTTDPGEVRFSWNPLKVDSPAELRLLELFFRGLADGERSLLYKSLIDSKAREFDSGATTVESEPFLANSPQFPVWNLGVSGIPGKRITSAHIDRIKDLLLSRIREISEYPDRSDHLVAFNDLLLSYSRSRQRSQSVWIKSPPGFASGDNRTDWKEHFEALEMDPSFVRSLPEQAVWQAVDSELKSGRNIWRDLIRKFRLLDTPYAAAAAPSPQLLEDLEKKRQERIANEIKLLMERYHTSDEQEALSRFEQEELRKTREIDQLAARVSRPRFTDHPPLTPDDEIQYQQFQIDGVAVIATLFDRPTSIDLGFSFDLNKIPPRYYKYLPILPRCFDSLGLKRGAQVTSYSMLSEAKEKLLRFSVGYENNAASNRADLVIRASAVNVAEVPDALALISQIIHFNYLDVTNIDRLQDIITRRLSTDESYMKQGEQNWVLNPGYAFRYQDQPLVFAMNSQLTRAHWDARLSWLFHKPVDAHDVSGLGSFADSILARPSPVSREDLSQVLARTDLGGLQKELIEYWERNISFFPKSEVNQGLRQLTLEVQQDLRQGPAKTVEELKDLQRLVLDRKALHVDLMLSQAALDTIRPKLLRFLKDIPARPPQKRDAANSSALPSPILARLAKRYKAADFPFPWYVGLENPDGTSGNAVFYADFPGYDQLDNKSLVHMLASELFAGDGPQSFYKKAREEGLAYGIYLTSDPGSRLIWYYADRSPDIPSLVALANATAAKTSGLQDQHAVDYVLRQSFPFPRTALTFSERAKALAQDIRDGNTPEKIHRFSEAILRLRQHPNLFSELTQAGFVSICRVLLNEQCSEQQRAARSLFFFVGPVRVLDDIEHRLAMPRLLRIWPSDYWIE